MYIQYTSMPFVATPAPVVEQPGMQAKEFPTPRLSESPKFLPSFGLSSSSPSPTLPWGAAEDSSPPFLPNRVQEGRSQAVPDEESSFSVSPLSPGLFFRPPRGSTSPPAGGVLLPMTLMIRFWVICSLMRGVNSFRGQNPLSLCLCVWPSGLAILLDPPVLQTVLASGTSAPPTVGSSTAAPPMDSRECGLLETGLP